MSEPPAPDVAAELDRVEREHGCRVVYACESGSRAWGFASTDSDYDVRFVYVRPADWYLSIDLDRRRDVIEEPIDDVLDVSGWDLPKALNLYRRTNPPLYEWLGSPIVYRDRLGWAEELLALAPAYWNPKAAAYHHLSMCRNMWDRYLQRERVSMKKVLYALRPLLAVAWIDRGLGVVPTEFATLVEATVEEVPVRTAIATLLEEKAAGVERADRDPDPVLHGFLAREIRRLEADVAAIEPPPPGDTECLNAVFRRVLREAWAAG